MLKLTGTKYSYARARQQVTVAVADQGVRHTFLIEIAVGDVGFRIGTAAGAQDMMSEITLGTGVHLISVVPPSNMHLEFNHVGYQSAYVRSVEIDTAGDLTLPDGFVGAGMKDVRYDQSGDVMYLACTGKKPKALRRRGTHSWSFEDYQPLDGPFENIHPGTTKITPSALNGDISLVASQDLFTGGRIGSLLKIDSFGQETSDVLSGADQFGAEIRVTGTVAARKFTVDISGTWSGTITLQKSYGEPGNWVDHATYNSNQSALEVNDQQDNQIIYYRLGFKTGDYTSGSATVELDYATGSNTGIVQITGLTDGKNATARVLKALGSTQASDAWYWGSWSKALGYPDSVVLHDGRLWWAGKNRMQGSISDAYESFDTEQVGESGPINRSIGSGPVERIPWLLSRDRLTVGGGSRVYTARAASTDEPLTPTTFGIKPSSSQGGSDIQALQIDEAAVYIQRSLNRVMSLGRNGNYDAVEELSVMVPEIGSPGIICTAVQFEPETALHCVRSDGKVAVLGYDRAENVKCWQLYEMGDPTETIVDVTVLPGDGREDHVYYTVKSGSGYYLTKFAQESECRGGDLNKQADLFTEYTGAAITDLAVPAVLEGRTVVIWADGQKRDPVVVSGGSVALGGSYTNVVVGLGYRARWKSTKLAYAAGLGTALAQKKTIPMLALILDRTSIDGLTYGRSFDKLDALPRVLRGATLADDSMLDTYDAPAMPLGGEWHTDARLCLEANAPSPATVMAAIISVDTNDKI